MNGSVPRQSRRKIKRITEKPGQPGFLECLCREVHSGKSPQAWHGLPVNVKGGVRIQRSPTISPFKGIKLMKKLFSVLITTILVASASHAFAESSPVGSWQFASYHVPGGGFYANQIICFKADNTWYSSSQAGWKGAWFQNGEELQWNGSVPMNGAGSANNLATIAMGKFIAVGSMSGSYAEWSAPSGLPLSWDRHYTYTMAYKSATCAAPK